MRILVLSDLHLELGSPFYVPESLDYDVAVLAGDIQAPGQKAVRWARRHSTFGGRPVIVVPGNHEFYGTEMSAELALMRASAQNTNVHVLARDVAIIGDVRFVGAMLWTDFALPVRTLDGTANSDVDRALEASSQCMNDYRRIRVEDRDLTQVPGWVPGQRLLTAADTLRMHAVDRHWLQGELAKPFHGPTVVVTHHAPAAGSVAKRYAVDWVTPAFVSALPDAFFAEVDLWIHGHTHTAFDYKQGSRCRVVSNPRGYRLRDSSFENAQFNESLVVEVTHT
jgi:predicted phosphodiesterase